MSESLLVEARGLGKVYPGGVVAVDSVDLEANRGVTILMGPNGSGKTTTLAMIAGALKPTGGTVKVCGYDVWGSDWSKPRECIGYAPQNMPFREKLSVLENLVWYGLIRGVSLGEARSRARRLLEEVGLSGKEKAKVAVLSGGMRRRLIIAAALMGDPRVLILDEPTSGLDPRGRSAFWSIVKRLSRDRAVIASTHIPEEAEEAGDVVYIFYRGRVAAHGPPHELIRRHAPKARIVVYGRRLSRAPRVEGAVLVSAGEEQAVYATGDPGEVLPRIVEALVEAEVIVERVEVRKPGLAEVYMAVTGVEAPHLG